MKTHHPDVNLATITALLVVPVGRSAQPITMNLFRSAQPAFSIKFEIETLANHDNTNRDTDWRWITCGTFRYYPETEGCSNEDCRSRFETTKLELRG